MPGGLQLIEPVPVEDDLCTGLALVEDVGFGGRFVFYTMQTAFEAGSVVNIVKRKIVVPRSAIIAGVALVAAYVDGSTPRPDTPMLPLRLLQPVK